MTNEKILKKAIEKANKNGLDCALSGSERIVKIFKGSDIAKKMLPITEFIFSHDFAKAFFGEKKYCKELIGIHCCTENCLKISWQYHLQQMVLEKNPIEYLEKFL